MLVCVLANSKAHFDLDAATILHEMSSQQQFLTTIEESRWNVGKMEYLDGVSTAVLRHPYTLAFDEDGSLFVASFTLNHVRPSMFQPLTE